MQDRLAYGQVYGVSPERKVHGTGTGGGSMPKMLQQPMPRAFAAPSGGGPRRRRGRSAGDADESGGAARQEEGYVGSRWGFDAGGFPLLLLHASLKRSLPAGMRMLCLACGRWFAMLLSLQG
jgi:hypothetical protein